MKLLHDNILAEPIQDDITTRSGIYLGVNESKIGKNRAKVIQVSDKVEHVKVGDTIEYIPEASKEITLNDKNLIFVCESQGVVMVLS